MYLAHTLGRPSGVEFQMIRTHARVAQDRKIQTLLAGEKGEEAYQKADGSLQRQGLTK